MTEKTCDCGLPHVTKKGFPSCTAHSSGGMRPEIKGKPCGNMPMHGQTICRMHGGAHGTAKAKAEERIRLAEAEKLMRKFSEPIQVDPAEGLLDLICRTAGHVQWLRYRVDKTIAEDEGSLVWGLTKSKSGGDDWGSTSEAKPNAWLQLYDRWTDKLAKLYVEALKIGLDERRVRLAEQQGDMIAAILDGVLTDLGHNPLEPKVAQVVVRHLKLADAG